MTKEKSEKLYEELSEVDMYINELFKEMCIEDEIQYEYQHQESPSEDYFECEADYLNGSWCC